MISANEYKERRERLLDKLDEGTLVILFAGAARKSSADATYDFEVNRNFYYLTGIDQENSILMLVRGFSENHVILFIDEKDERKEKWTGLKLPTDEAVNISGIEDVLLTSSYEGKLEVILNKENGIYGLIKTVCLDLEKELKIAECKSTNEYATELGLRFPHIKVFDIYRDIANLRMVKSPEEIELIKDEINVVVPFKKMGNNVTNLNVGDQIQLTTTAKPSEVTWSTTSNSVLQVDATTGLVTAMGAGKATIIATRTQDELYTVYGLPYQLKYDFVVIDGFGLSTTSATVNIGDSFDLTALVTDEDLKKSPVTFKVENQPGADGITPTGTLVTTTQNGKVLTVKGVASGTVKITATQTINGVMKSETCVVYVTTPVGEITINPSSVTVDRGIPS